MRQPVDLVQHLHGPVDNRGCMPPVGGCAFRHQPRAQTQAQGADRYDLGQRLAIARDRFPRPEREPSAGAGQGERRESLKTNMAAQQAGFEPAAGVQGPVHTGSNVPQ